MADTFTLDPNPCRLYRWPLTSRCTTYNGAHACEYPGGHEGACRCGVCEKTGRGKDRAGPVLPPPPTTLTWLGAHPRRTLWRTSTNGAECLGWIVLVGDSWGAFVAPTAADGPALVADDPDPNAAARALCAYLRVGEVGLPTLTDRDDE